MKPAVYLYIFNKLIHTIVPQIPSIYARENDISAFFIIQFQVIIITNCEIAQNMQKVLASILHIN